MGRRLCLHGEIAFGLESFFMPQTSSEAILRPQACPVKPSFVIVSPGFRSGKGKYKPPLRSSRLGLPNLPNGIFLSHSIGVKSLLHLFHRGGSRNSKFKT